MMHKVKDVVSRFLNPSYLFSTNNETNQTKRKRLDSVHDDDDKEDETLRTNGLKSRYKTISNTSIRSDEKLTVNVDQLELTDDEENDLNEDLSSKNAKQDRKRRRTMNYREIISPITTNEKYQTEFPGEIDQTDTIYQLTASKQRFNIPRSYRDSAYNYDPLKSPLFSNRTREQTVNSRSNEFLANHLLGESLIASPQLKTTKIPSVNQLYSSRLTKPVANNNLSVLNVRSTSTTNYSPITSYRLPYIERLRRRTLQNSVRLNQTHDNEPSSQTLITVSESTPAISLSEPIKEKVEKKECGIQCDAPIIENEKNTNGVCTVPSNDIASDIILLSNEETNKRCNQTDSSIKTSSSILSDTIKPKVLGDIASFSWPKFTRAHEEYARKYPEKCLIDLTVEKEKVDSVQQDSALMSVKLPSSLPNSSDVTMQRSRLSNEYSTQNVYGSAFYGSDSTFAESNSISAQKSNVSKATTTWATVNTTTDNITTSIHHTTPSFGAVTSKASEIIKETPAIISLAPKVADISSKSKDDIVPSHTSQLSSIQLFGVQTTKDQIVTTNREIPLTATSIPWFVEETSKDNTASANTTPVLSPPTTKETIVTTSSVPTFGIQTNMDNSAKTNVLFSFGTKTTNEIPLFGIQTSKDAAASVNTTPSFGISISIPSKFTEPLFGKQSNDANNSPNSIAPQFGIIPNKESTIGSGSTPTINFPVIKETFPTTNSSFFSSFKTSKDNSIPTNVAPLFNIPISKVTTNPTPMFSIQTSKELSSIFDTTSSFNSVASRNTATLISSSSLINTQTEASDNPPTQSSTGFSQVPSTSATSEDSSSMPTSPIAVASSIQTQPNASVICFGVSPAATTLPSSQPIFSFGVSNPTSSFMTTTSSATNLFQNPVSSASSAPPSTNTNIFSQASTTDAFRFSSNTSAPTVTKTSTPAPFGTNNFFTASELPAVSQPLSFGSSNLPFGSHTQPFFGLSTIQTPFSFGTSSGNIQNTSQTMTGTSASSINSFSAYTQSPVGTTSIPGNSFTPPNLFATGGQTTVDTTASPQFAFQSTINQSSTTESDTDISEAAPTQQRRVIKAVRRLGKDNTNQ